MSSMKNQTLAEKTGIREKVIEEIQQMAADMYHSVQPPLKKSIDDEGILIYEKI